MNERFLRSAALFGEDGMAKLYAARVAVFGIGGVGGHAAEALARAGIGSIDLIDNDTVSATNINRQAVAATSTVGKLKTEVMRERILDINPDCRVRAISCFYSAETKDEIDLADYDYVIDAIDTVSSKLLLIEESKRCGTKIISSMGTGNKLDPTRLEISDIFKTSVCPLARVMRTELKKRGIAGLKVVYSKEEPIRVTFNGENGRHAPASTSFVPPAAGLILAAEVVKEIAGIK